MRKPKAPKTKIISSEIQKSNRINKARELRDRLSVPLTFLLTLRSAQHVTGDMANLMQECIDATKEARFFIGRYVADKPMDE